jgi:hypothetical protein
MVTNRHATKKNGIFGITGISVNGAVNGIIPTYIQNRL